MIEPQSMELASTLAGLVATYLTEVARQKGTHSSEGFQSWLERTAFPELRRTAEQTLTTVVSLKATDTERYNTLIDHLFAIRRAVGAERPGDEWQTLCPVDRAILTQLYEAAHNDSDVDLEPDAIAVDLSTSPEELVRSARYLSERGLLLLREYAGYWNVGPLPRGVLLAWAVLSPDDFHAATQRLKDTLRTTDALRLRELSTKAQVPIGLTAMQVMAWSDQGLVQFADGYAPFDAGIVRPTEMFRRNP